MYINSYLKEAYIQISIKLNTGTYTSMLKLAQYCGSNPENTYDRAKEALNICYILYRGSINITNKISSYVGNKS